MRRILVFVSWGLLTVLAGIVGLAAISDVRGRATSPEAIVRGYFQALEGGDVAAALERVDPSQRETWRDFVENGALNEYRISGMAVRRPSLLSQMRGAGDELREVTVFLDITQWASGVNWQASPRVPLVEHEGRWYLARPPLAP